MANILWTIITILFVFWLIGFVLHFGGALIHIVLVVALGLFIFNLLTRGRATV
ncbi:MAG TPA: lmo0937 family membrane protein [Chthonomonadaceae bacterium]|nr:lmo0937 family membrane protein [Chthonomonadaceae bacterium]